MESEKWLRAWSPPALLTLLGSKASERKLRSFGVACCKSLWERLTDPRSRKAIEMAEQAADNLVAPHLLEMAAADAARVVGTEHDPAANAAALVARPRLNIAISREIVRDTQEYLQWPLVATYLRDIFGNPFQPIEAADWLTADVVGVARAIYEDNGFERMPILSDALLEAGCDNPEMIRHCQFTAWHTRGCWLVDLLLGNE